MRLSRARSECVHAHGQGSIPRVGAHSLLPPQKQRERDTVTVEVNLPGRDSKT